MRPSRYDGRKVGNAYVYAVHRGNAEFACLLCGIVSVVPRSLLDRGTIGLYGCGCDRVAKINPWRAEVGRPLSQSLSVRKGTF
jgi:hypothetical protein